MHLWRSFYYYYQKQATHQNDLNFLKKFETAHDNLRKGQLQAGSWIKDWRGTTVWIVFDMNSEPMRGEMHMYLTSSFISDTL